MPDSGLVAMLERALDDARHIVAAIEPEQWQVETPCAAWDLGTLVSHLVGGVEGFSAIGRGREMSAEEPSLTPTDAGAALDAAASRALEIWNREGLLDETLTTPWGEMPGSMIAGFFLIEVVTHSWDIIRTAGLDAAQDPDAVSAAFDLARLYADDSTRTPQLFGLEIEVPETAPTIERLAGFLGRTP
jgi:uncharacterized protein (TIGR03086 family)